MLLPEPLLTPRLHIRPLTADDLAAVFACYDNVEVRRYCAPVRWPDMDYAAAWFARMQARVADGVAQQFVIARRDNGAIIGTCVLFNIDNVNRRAEIGYALGRDHWGGGYMQEAVARLIDHAFDTLKLHRIEAEIDPRNEASARGLLRLGFSHDGTLKDRYLDDNEFADAGLYGLLESVWTTRTASH